MINIFRRLRRKLFAENRLRRYSLYAIGEIALVVIGILLALAINNWNEGRKSEQKTVQFLNSLKSDLENDLREIQLIIDEQELRKNAMTDAITLSKDPDVQQILAKDTSDLIYAGTNVTFFPVLGSYKSATNAGLVDNIKDPELKRSILNLYEHFYTRVQYNAEINDDRTGQIDWESRQLIDKSKKAFAFKKEALLNEDFVSQIGYLNRFFGFYLMRCRDTRAAIIETLTKIEQYLD